MGQFVGCACEPLDWKVFGVGVVDCEEAFIVWCEVEIGGYGCVEFGYLVD